eukprot:gene10124-biopygen8913
MGPCKRLSLGNDFDLPPPRRRARPRAPYVSLSPFSGRRRRRARRPGDPRGPDGVGTDCPSPMRRVGKAAIPAWNPTVFRRWPGMGTGLLRGDVRIPLEDLLVRLDRGLALLAHLQEQDPALDALRGHLPQHLVEALAVQRLPLQADARRARRRVPQAARGIPRRESHEVPVQPWDSFGSAWIQLPMPLRGRSGGQVGPVMPSSRSAGELASLGPRFRSSFSCKMMAPRRDDGSVDACCTHCTAPRRARRLCGRPQTHEDAPVADVAHEDAFVAYGKRGDTFAASLREALETPPCYVLYKLRSAMLPSPLGHVWRLLAEANRNHSPKRAVYTVPSCTRRIREQDGFRVSPLYRTLQVCIPRNPLISNTKMRSSLASNTMM